MRSDTSVTISVRLDRGLYSRLRSEAEREPDHNGRASVRGVVLRALTREFAEPALAGIERRDDRVKA